LEDKIIHWTANALEQLADLYNYMAERSVLSAEKYVDGLHEFTERLKKHPESCAPCRHASLRDTGYRCCNFRNHIIIYKLTDVAAETRAIVHSRRNPDIFGELVD